LKVGDLIKHKWGKDFGIVVGRPGGPYGTLVFDVELLGLYGKYTAFGNVTITDDNYWYVMFGTKTTMVHEDSCEVLNAGS